MCQLRNILFFICMVGFGRCSDSHCCVTSTFSTRLRVETATAAVGVTPRMDINDIFMSYDRDNKIEVLSGTITTDAGGSLESTVNYTVINDYGNGKSYNFGDYQGYDYCNVSQIDMNDMNDGCVPSTFNLTGTFPLGSGSDSAMINAFEGMEGNVRRTIVMTANECNPITMSRLGMLDDGSYIKENMLFIGFLQNATFSANTFAIPSSCKAMG